MLWWMHIKVDNKLVMQYKISYFHNYFYSQDICDIIIVSTIHWFNLDLEDIMNNRNDTSK